ncbi:thiol reductant ABC exporter subunit CydD [Oryzibacter oryziterrae]|uniref:thiol reductant ABC exporter subunit CydD n=1 Tax=Oryzibacter oryziterrae TaxID=2766474 RepID=UPI001F01CDB0|nr:thiol reductant ABC exporter subunit CydD [Oryzibacter oryziterrae]
MTSLKSLNGKAGPAIGVAMATRALAGLIGLAMAWFLSGAIAAVVFDGADIQAVQLSLALIAGLALLRALAAFASDRSAFRASAAVRGYLFASLLDQAARLGPVRLSGTPTGEIATLFLEAVAGVEPYWRRWMPALAQVSLLPLVILLVAFPLDWLTGLVLFATLPLLPLFMILAGRAAESASQRQWATLARLGGHLLDAIRALPDLKLLGAAGRSTGEVAAAAEAYRKSTMGVLRLAFLSALVLEFFATVSIALVAVLVGFRLMWGTFDFRTGFFLLLLAPEFYAPLRQLGLQRHAKMEAEAAAERLFAFLDRSGETASTAAAAAPNLSRIGLTFEEVTVRHEDGRLALDGVSFSVAAGEQLALVGESGSGKSTVLALLCGFLQPTGGRILVNGQPLDGLDPTLWRKALTVVAQKPHLFDWTLADNVAMAEGNDADAVRLALAAARAEEIVRRLPEGLASRLGEAASGVSGGEAQRLALARAFHRRSPLVLADEPTAHLDADTERDIAEAMARLAAGRTMITVAHRLETVQRADQVLVLERGRIVEGGRPAELLTRAGAFARLMASGAVLASDRRAAR